MGSFRFTKRIKIAPGLTLNLNKKSISLTAGVRGAHATVNSKGYRTLSAGIPGSGLSYRDTRKLGAKPGQPAPTPAPAPDEVRRLEVWRTEVNGTVVILVGSWTADTPTTYDLFAWDAASGWWRVGVCYPDEHSAAEAGLRWEAYLHNGGTITSWLQDLGGGIV